MREKTRVCFQPKERIHNKTAMLIAHPPTDNLAATSTLTVLYMKCAMYLRFNSRYKGTRDKVKTHYQTLKTATQRSLTHAQSIYCP